MALRVRAGLYGDPEPDWRRRIAEESPRIPLQSGLRSGTGVVALQQERRIELTYENLPPSQWSPGWQLGWESWFYAVIYHSGPSAGIGDTSNKWVGLYTGGDCGAWTCDVNEIRPQGGAYYWYEEPCNQHPQGTAPPSGQGFVVRSLGLHGCTQHTPDAEVSFAETASDPKLVSVSRTPAPGTWVPDLWPEQWTDPGVGAVRAGILAELGDPASPLARWYHERLALPPAQRFRPLLFFDTQEKWRPLNINEFLAEGTRYGFDHHHWCGNADATTCAPILDASSLRTYSDGNRFDDRIDIAGEPGGASSDYT
jgi:hypothetical protein